MVENRGASAGVRRCEQCGKPLETSNIRARTCSSTCRRKRSQGIEPSWSPELVEPVEPVAFTGLVEAAVRRELAEAGRLESAAGAICLRLAATIDSPTTSGSERASLARQLHASIELALGDAIADDPVGAVLDELSLRRSRRGS